MTVPTLGSHDLTLRKQVTDEISIITSYTNVTFVLLYTRKPTVSNTISLHFPIYLPGSCVASPIQNQRPRRPQVTYSLASRILLLTLLASQLHTAHLQESDHNYSQRRIRIRDVLLHLRQIRVRLQLLWRASSMCKLAS